MSDETSEQLRTVRERLLEFADFIGDVLADVDRAIALIDGEAETPPEPTTARSA